MASHPLSFPPPTLGHSPEVRASLQGEGGLLGFAVPLPEGGEEAGIQLQSFREFQATSTCVGDRGITWVRGGGQRSWLRVSVPEAPPRACYGAQQIPASVVVGGRLLALE